MYEDYGALEVDFLAEELHPLDLKQAAGEYVAEFVAPIRERLTADPELLRSAYPETYGDDDNGDEH